jgi:hypothetical protein
MSGSEGKKCELCFCAWAGISIFTTFLTPLINWLLIYYWEFRLDGAAMANIVEALLFLLLIASYFLWRESRLKQSGRHTLQSWCGAVPSTRIFLNLVLR